MTSTTDTEYPGVKVRCSSKMIHGFKNLLKTEDTPSKLKACVEPYNENDEIPFFVLREIQEYCKSQKGIYFHELMEASEIIIPHYEPPPRDPELEARVQRLRNEQANKEYRKMTKNVTFERRYTDDDMKSFGREIKSVQKMLITIFNFVLTVAGSFAFAYKATEYAMNKPNIAIQLCMGLIVGTVVFFADLYFVMKHEMVEEGTVGENVYDKKIQ